MSEIVLGAFIIGLLTGCFATAAFIAAIWEGRH